MIALSNAVEPLRMANIVTGEPVYEWSIVSIDGQPVRASNGLELSPTIPLEQAGKLDILFVCGGVDVQEVVTPKILAALRRLAELALAVPRATDRRLAAMVSAIVVRVRVELARRQV